MKKRLFNLGNEISKAKVKCTNRSKWKLSEWSWGICSFDNIFFEHFGRSDSVSDFIYHDFRNLLKKCPIVRNEWTWHTHKTISQKEICEYEPYRNSQANNNTINELSWLAWKISHFRMWCKLVVMMAIMCRLCCEYKNSQ